MIRLILCVLYLLLFLALGLIPALIFFLIGRKNPALKDRLSFRFVRWGFSCLTFLSGTKLTAEGLENIPADQAVLFVANHRSYFDVVAGYTLLQRPTGYVAKVEFARIPLLRLWMRNIHCLFLDRANVREGLKTILQGAEEVKSGVSMWIFPEGTRNKGEEGTQLEYKAGALKIAERADCLIIPVAITHTADVLETHFPFVRSTAVTFRFGTPIDLKSLPKEQKKFAGTYVQNVIGGMLEEMLKQ